MHPMHPQHHDQIAARNGAVDRRIQPLSSAEQRAEHIRNGERMRVFMDFQDEVSDGVVAWARRMGLDEAASRGDRRTTRFAQGARARSGSARTPQVRDGTRVEHAAEFDTRHSQLIRIGSGRFAAKAAEDGDNRTECYVELTYDEGVVATGTTRNQRESRRAPFGQEEAQGGSRLRKAASFMTRGVVAREVRETGIIDRVSLRMLRGPADLALVGGPTDADNGLNPDGTLAEDARFNRDARLSNGEAALVVYREYDAPLLSPMERDQVTAPERAPDDPAFVRANQEAANVHVAPTTLQTLQSINRELAYVSTHGMTPRG